MKMAEMDDETITHLVEVIAYSIVEEKKNYEDMIIEGEPVTGHIYISLAVLYEWVRENREDALSEFIRRRKADRAT
jgi:hypothetical protein